jgi:hypothetical protein
MISRAVNFRHALALALLLPMGAMAVRSVGAAEAPLPMTASLGQPSAAASAAALASKSLRPLAEFQRISDPRERSVALFNEMGKVLQHPRCVNCHPASERPMQTDAMRPHEPLVVRGPDGHGHATGLRCDTCHMPQNFDAARVPGNPKWGLAPAEMAWEGRTLGQICEQIKDPARNHQMSLDAIVKHMAEDSLVGWAWNPGPGRTPAPGTQREFGELTRAWAASGARCPG